MHVPEVRPEKRFSADRRATPHGSGPREHGCCLLMSVAPPRTSRPRRRAVPCLRIGRLVPFPAASAKTAAGVAQSVPAPRHAIASSRWDMSPDVCQAPRRALA